MAIVQPKRPMRPKYVATKLLFYEAAKPTSNRRPESKTQVVELERALNSSFSFENRAQVKPKLLFEPTTIPSSYE